MQDHLRNAIHNSPWVNFTKTCQLTKNEKLWVSLEFEWGHD